MSRKDLAKSLAREQKMPDAQARDRVDEVVYRILKKLREGRSVPLSGVGTLVPESNPKARR